jgi:hypothetical protein
LPGNSPGEAVDNFLEPVKDAIQCVGDGVLVYRDHPGLGQLEAATLNGGEGMGIRSAIFGRLRLEVNFQYVLLESDDERGPYRCSTRGYIFSISDREDHELVSFHWHPLSVSPDLGPHMHIGTTVLPQTGTLHVATPRVTVEDVIEHLADSFAVDMPLPEGEWRPRIERSREVHVTWRDWHERGEAPTVFPERENP